MNIDEMIEILQNYRKWYGNLEVLLVGHMIYAPVEKVKFIGGQRCVLINEKEDETSLNWIQSVEKNRARYENIQWLADCEDHTELSDSEFLKKIFHCH